MLWIFNSMEQSLSLSLSFFFLRIWLSSSWSRNSWPFIEHEGQFTLTIKARKWTLVFIHIKSIQTFTFATLNLYFKIIFALKSRSRNSFFFSLCFWIKLLYAFLACSYHPVRHIKLTHSRSWALLEKSPIVQPLKKFPAFYGTRRFIAVFKKPPAGPYPERQQFNPYHHILSL
jgi:hypothetical protein